MGGHVTRWIPFALLVGLIAVPAAQACHPASVEQVGVVATDDGPREATILFDHTACEGTVDVTVDVDDGSEAEPFEAELGVTRPGGGDCLPWDVCAPAWPPVASFELVSEDPQLNLTGTVHNAGHTNQAAPMVGTYRGQPAVFATVKPI